MKKMLHVFVFTLFTVGLSFFFYACDEEAHNDEIPEIEEPVNDFFPAQLYNEGASIADLVNGRLEDLIGYLDPEERVVYLNFEFFETVQMELHATPLEEEWLINAENSTGGVRYALAPIEGLDFAAVPSPRAKLVQKKSKCITIKADCYNQQDLVTGEKSSMKIPKDIDICAFTGIKADVCTYKNTTIEITEYPKVDCKGEGTKRKYSYHGC